MVSKAQNAATVVTDGNADGTKVTLGENANVVIDKYVFDPDQGVGEASLNVTEGAFRFVTGRMKEMSNKSITVNTTAAQIGVRGTDFWGGPIASYGVYVFTGAVDVTALGTTVGVGSGLGTLIPAGGVPGVAGSWSAARIAQILNTISFKPGGGLPQEQPQQQQYQQQQQQQQGGQQQATTTTQPYAVTTPVVVGGVVATAVVAGVVIGTTTSNDNNNNNEGGRGPSTP